MRLPAQVQIRIVADLPKNYGILFSPLWAVISQSEHNIAVSFSKRGQLLAFGAVFNLGEVFITTYFSRCVSIDTKSGSS
jgi:hypothetical protein